MMPSDEESFTIDGIVQALINNGDEFRGRYYLIEEMSMMIGGAPLDEFANSS